MSWSKVNTNTKKPLGWWYYKIMCEFWYYVGDDVRYYKYLNILCDKYKINLYGDELH